MLNHPSAAAFRQLYGKTHWTKNEGKTWEKKTQWEDSFSLESAASGGGLKSPGSLTLREWLGVTLGCRCLGCIYLQKLDAKSWTLCIQEEICSKKEHLNNVEGNIKNKRRVLAWDLRIDLSRVGVGMELLIQDLKFMKVSGNETETAWVPVLLLLICTSRPRARWNWLSGTNASAKTEDDKPKDKAPKKELGPVIRPRLPARKLCWRLTK